MKSAPFLVLLTLELVLLALYIRAEYFLLGWSGLSSKEIAESKDAAASIAQLIWESGFFLGCMLGLSLMILSLKFARKIGVTDLTWSWALLVIPITVSVWIIVIK